MNELMELYPENFGLDLVTPIRTPTRLSVIYLQRDTEDPLKLGFI
ncbi:MAG: hypothetical protein QXE34_01855 [Candidatus Aenigmatarchaeota archaeon]